MPYPYQNILLCRWSPGCDVHYDAKPALSIPSKLSVPRIHPYWFVLVRTDTYRTVSYHTIHTYIQLPWPHPTSAILILYRFSQSSVLRTSSSLSPLGAPSLLPSLPSLYYLIVGGPWKGWCTISSISVFKLIFLSFFFSSHTEYILWAYESYKLTWIDVN